MAFNNKDLNLEWGDVYVATDYDFGTDVVAKINDSWTNQDVVANAINSSYTFVNVWYAQDISFFHSLEEEKSVKADNCGKWEIYASATLTPRLEWTWLEVDNVDNLAFMTGLNVQNVAWTPVAVTAEAHGTWWIVWVPFRLNNRNWDNTVVASIAVKENAIALILNTDYSVFVWDWSNGDLWFTYITPLTAQTLAITVDYTFTPSVTQYLGYEVKAREIPYTLFKVISCPNENGEYNTYYFKKAKLNAEIQQALTNLDRNELAWSSMSFTWVTGSTWIESKGKVS